MAKLHSKFYLLTIVLFSALLLFYSDQIFSKSRSGVQHLVRKYLLEPNKPDNTSPKAPSPLTGNRRPFSQQALVVEAKNFTESAVNIPTIEIEGDVRDDLTDEQKKVVDDTLALEKEMLKAATPKGFVDVPRSGVDPVELEKLRPQDIEEARGKHPIVGKDSYTAIYLWERAKNFKNDTKVGQFLAEQKRRRLHVRAACSSATSSIPISAHGSLSLGSYPRMIFDRADHLTFCPIYKSASTSWSINLLQLRGLWRTKAQHRHGVQAMLKAVFPPLSATTGPAMTANSIKFMVVRHPLDRLVSCYRDKYKDGRKGYYYRMYGEKMVRRYRKLPQVFTPEEGDKMLKQVRQVSASGGSGSSLKGNPYAHPVGPTFEEFVKYVSESHRSDEHWRPYYQHCSSCFVKYDFVLKFEHLYDESKNLIEFLNRSKELDVRWDNKATMGVSTRDIACQYFKTVTLDTMEKLLNKYAIDFILYEYTADDYVKCLKDYKPGMSLNIKVPKMHPRDFNFMLPVR